MDDTGILMDSGYIVDILGKFHHDLTATSLEMMVFIGKSSPFIAKQFRLVNYSNLPSWDGTRNCEI